MLWTLMSSVSSALSGTKLNYSVFFIFLVLRQLNMSIAISTLTSGQCKLAPLIQVIQDCSHLYHYTVKLLFKLHACKSSSSIMHLRLIPVILKTDWFCKCSNNNEVVNVLIIIKLCRHFLDLYIFWKLMFFFCLFVWFLLTGLPADTLQGHRERFLEQFQRYI